MAHTYVDYSKRIQLEVNENTLDNIQKQIDTLSVLISEKEGELLSFKDDNAILNLSKEEDDFFKEYVNFNKVKREIEQKKVSVKALLEYLQSTDDTRVLPPSLYVETKDMYLLEAINVVRSKQIEYEINKTQESEDNLGMVNKRKEIALLKNDIKMYLTNLVTALDKELLQTNNYIDDYKTDIKKLPKSAQGVMNIQRELDVNNKMYLFLLEKKTNTLIARAGIIPQVRIIEKTVGTGIIYPNKTKLIRLFVLGGILLALMIAIIRTLFFERIEGLSQLHEITSMNVLGGIPYIKKLELDHSLVVEKNPKSQVNESFRTVRTNLSFMGEIKEKRTAKRIMLSSFFSGEGKTFCSTNLSNLIAKGEKKVLIIDFDLHRPKIHKTYKLKNIIGVTNFIIGKSTFEEIVHKNVFPNLDVIAAGPIAPNPSELILRDKVNELFEIADKIYDYIIIDTPPFGLLNDSLELTKFADSFLIILNTKYARKKGVEHISEMLSKFDNVSKGLVLNGIKESRFQYYYSKYTYKYNYSYNYGYSYGYGSNYSQDEES
jgi:capsular exopolysaccharide synthesis family protein